VSLLPSAVFSVDDSSASIDDFVRIEHFVHVDHTTVAHVASPFLLARDGPERMFQDLLFDPLGKRL